MVYVEYADRHRIEPISENFRPNSDPKSVNPHSIHDQIGKKTISRYCPFSNSLVETLLDCGCTVYPICQKSTDSPFLPNTTIPTLPMSSASCAQPHTDSFGFFLHSHCPLYLSFSMIFSLPDRICENAVSRSNS